MYSYYWEYCRLTGSIKLSAEMPIQVSAEEIIRSFVHYPRTNYTGREKSQSSFLNVIILYIVFFFFLGYI